MGEIAVGRFVKPEAVATHFHLCDGDKVADFGAGAGYFLKTLSESVGASGRVYACDIQKNLVERLGLVAKEAHLPNVEPLWCDFETDHGTKLVDGILDAGMFVNTLYQTSDKAAALKEAARVIKRGGMLFVIDWTESYGGLGPEPGDIINAEAAGSIVEAAGFQFERSFDAGEHHYGLSFRKV